MQIGHMALQNIDGHTAGRQLLAQMYENMTGGALPEILVTDRGKPYLKNGALHFSVSHTKNHVFCVLSERPVGIDAEEMSRKADLRLAEKILSPMEKAQFDAAEDKTSALLRLWVLKEAAGKLTGQGINGYPNQTEFSVTDPRITEMNGCFVAVIQEEEYVI